ncbi:hypothetical protein KCP75_10680 [Salmonella enterica subsp. enterica]|nr:hypothetical protein KCP75_10680 [Salmonella enterica subsp. enterica]
MKLKTALRCRYCGTTALILKWLLRKSVSVIWSVLAACHGLPRDRCQLF